MRLALDMSLTCMRQGGGGGEDTPAWLEDFRAPSGNLPVAVADFDNAHYWAGDQEVAAAAVIDHPELIDVNGLGNPSDQTINLIGDALSAAITMSWTLVLAWTVPDENQGGYIFKVIAEEDQVFEVQNRGVTVHITVNDRDGFFTRGADSVGAEVIGLNKVAVSRTDAALRFSLNGEAVVEVTTPSISPLAVTLARFLLEYIDPGSVPSVRHLCFYSTVQPTADLPALSAL